MFTHWQQHTFDRTQWGDNEGEDVTENIVISSFFFLDHH